MKSLIGNLCVIAIVAISSQLMADTFNVYNIGNSLTEDMNSTLPILATNYLSPLGRTYYFGRQIRHGSDLTYIFNHPNDPVTKDYYNSPAPFTSALPAKHWDVVTFQPYYSGSEPSTLATDTEAINAMIMLTRTNVTNASTRFFIYSAWPQTLDGDINSYSNRFLSFTSNDTKQTSLLSRDYVRYLTESVRKSHSDVSVIPAGEVLFVIDQQMRAGKISGFSSIHQLYRDKYHLNGMGKNVVGAVAYAAIFGKNPTGLEYISVSTDNDAKFCNNLPTQFLDAPGVLAVHDPGKMALFKADLKIMQQIAWDFVPHKN